MKLKYSFPKLKDNLLDKVDIVLNENFGYSAMPADYRKFLLKNNGGYVSPGFIDDTDKTTHTQEIIFDTPLKWARDNDKPVTPCLVMFFGIWLESEMNENEVENWDLYDLILSNEHSKNDFDILPNNMMSIAKCSHPDADDMLCISVDKIDYGSVYFYYGMHDHPVNPMGSYYADKAEKIFEYYKIENEDDIDEDTAEGKEILTQLSRVPFIKVANSLNEFLNSCRTEASVT